MSIRIPEFVQKLAPYVPGGGEKDVPVLPHGPVSSQANPPRIVKLASNENPLGPSPKALEAIRESLPRLNRYTDPACPELVAAISRAFGVDRRHVICGHGTDSLLAYIIGAFTEEKDEILTSEGTFIGLYVNVRKIGRRIVKVPLREYAFDLGGLLGHITEYTRMIYLANPNNPTGTLFTRGELEDFMSGVPRHVMVVLDEAYTPYVGESADYPNGLACDYENMVVTRTFSKAYGLAGLRAGFAVGPNAVIEALYKVRLPFEPGLLSQQAAIAALEDADFLKQTVALNRRSLNRLEEALDELNLPYVKSHANFLMLLFPDPEKARTFYRGCLSRGLILRPLEAFGIPEGLRISSGSLEDTEYAVGVLRDVYESLS